MIYLVEITAYNLNTEAEEVLRYCTGSGFVTQPTETPANAFYDPRIKQPALMQRTIFANGTTYGGSQTAYGELVLSNSDGLLDYLIDYSFDGRQIIVRIGEQESSYPDGFEIVMSGTMEHPQFDWNTVSVKLRDRQAELSVPIQPVKFSGGNESLSPPTGVEGNTADIKGKPKPITYGTVYNTSPPCINTAKLVYQINDGNTDVVSVYERGASITRGTDYTSLSDLMTNDPSSLTYRVWPDGGMFRLGTSPVGQITADVVQGSTSSDRTVAQIVKAILLNRAGLTTSDIYLADFTALDSANSSEVGVYIDSEKDIATVLDELCASVGAWWGFDRVGKFRIARLELPSGTPQASLDQVDIISISRSSTTDTDKGIPAYRVNLNYQLNYTTQDSDINAAVSSSRKAFVAEKYRISSSTDSTVLSKHLLSPEMEFSTLLISETSANSEAARRLAMYSARRDRYDIKIRVDASTAHLFDLGNVISVTLLRFGLDYGKLFRIIGVRTDYRVNQIELTLWG